MPWRPREGQLRYEADARTASRNVMHDGSRRRRWADSQSCLESPFPPNAMGANPGTPAQPTAQFDERVAAGGQRAALAKVSGAKESICAWERVVVDWRTERGEAPP